jgi:hypothetical protein
VGLRCGVEVWGGGGWGWGGGGGGVGGGKGRSKTLTWQTGSELDEKDTLHLLMMWAVVVHDDDLAERLWKFGGMIFVW